MPASRLFLLLRLGRHYRDDNHPTSRGMSPGKECRMQIEKLSEENRTIFNSDSQGPARLLWSFKSLNKSSSAGLMEILTFILTEVGRKKVCLNK